MALQVQPNRCLSLSSLQLAVLPCSRIAGAVPPALFALAFQHCPCAHVNIVSKTSLLQLLENNPAGNGVVHIGTVWNVSHLIKNNWQECITPDQKQLAGIHGQRCRERF
jgi:hypothetical protein